MSKDLSKEKPGSDLSKEESAAIFRFAADIRPTENVHADPKLADPIERPGSDLSEEESAAILRFAADIRPGENVHPDEPEEG